MEHDDQTLTEHERDLFAALPRETHGRSGDADRLLAVLRRDGVIAPRPLISRTARPWALAAAGMALFLAGAFTGQRFATRNSLERALARTNLTVADRILLLQRAGSAYVTAANGYANATQRADSTAVEVANQVLRGAAHAVVRSNLNTRTASNLLVALQGRDTTSHKSLLWY